MYFFWNSTESFNKPNTQEKKIPNQKLMDGNNTDLSIFWTAKKKKLKFMR